MAIQCLRLREPTRRRMLPEPTAPPALVFRRIGPFAVNKSAVTPALKQQVKRVADFVRSRLDTAQAHRRHPPHRTHRRERHGD